ncbi:hypothetical protein HKD37_12G032926 [Glycine soja]
MDDEKIIIGDMTKSMIKPKNILLTLKVHNANSSRIMKQVYNAIYAYRSSIRGINNNTYKTNGYMLFLLNIVGVIPTGMTFSAAFAYLEGEHIKNVVWALERDLTLMNAVKIIFLESTNLLCRFHIDKNVKAKCKTLVGQKNLTPHKERFIKVWKNKVMHLENTTTNMVESAHWALKRLLQNSLGITSLLWPMFVDYVKQTWLTPHKERFIKVMHLGNTTTNMYENCKYIQEMKAISKRCEEIDVCGKLHHYLNNQNQRGRCPCWINFIHAFMISLKTLSMSKLMCDEYIYLLGGIDKYEELKRLLLVDGLFMHDVFPLKSQPPRDSSIHHIICIGHVHDNYFVQVFLRDGCPLSPTTLLWSTYCHYHAKQWPTPYIGKMHQYINLMRLTTHYVDLGEN